MLVKLISIYLFLGVMLLAVLFVNSFSKGKTSYAKLLGALSITLQIYLLGYLIEINAESLKEMVFWNHIQYFGIPFFPGLWLVISILYTGRGKLLKGYRSLLIFAIPILTFFIHLTNQWNHLYYRKVQLQEFQGKQIMLLEKGPWYLVQMIYVLVTLVLCTWFYFKRYRESDREEKIQFLLLLVASILPYLALILVAVNLGGIGIDFTAIILPPCVFLINLALTQYNFLEIQIMARERVFEKSESGLVLLNRDFQVVDYNDSSIQMFQWLNTQIREEKIEKILSEKQDILQSILKLEKNIFRLRVEQEDKYLSVNAAGIQNKGKTVGILLTFEDVTEREELRCKLLEIASTDELSGLPNRRKFREGAEAAFARALRYKEKLSVLMIDMDHFKNINDSYGHHIGDIVIQRFSQMLLENFRGTDIVGRVGGEEFAVVMIRTEEELAYQRAEDFRDSVKREKIAIENGSISVTISIGISELDSEIKDFDTLVNLADKYLYDAKHNGRNCTNSKNHSSCKVDATNEA